MYREIICLASQDAFADKVSIIRAYYLQMEQVAWLALMENSTHIGIPVHATPAGQPIQTHKNVKLQIPAGTLELFVRDMKTGSQRITMLDIITCQSFMHGRRHNTRQQENIKRLTHQCAKYRQACKNITGMSKTIR